MICLPGWLGFISHPLALICYAGGSRPASQSRIPVEHRQVRIRDSEEGTPARGWAYFTYPARLTPLDTPRKVYTNPLAKSCISCEKGWIYRKNRYNDPEAGLCSGKDPSTCRHASSSDSRRPEGVARLPRAGAIALGGLHDAPLWPVLTDTPKPRRQPSADAPGLHVFPGQKRFSGVVPQLG